MRIGYTLSCEEYPPATLVDQARRAQDAGFDALSISDHFHPWNDEQGQSPFVWSLIGAVSQVCDLPVVTMVTCPTVRIHPVLVAQAAATSAVLLGGGFTLGVGSGEALNEHITGQVWPSADVRLEMLEEAIGLIRRLWTEDGFVSHRGRHYTCDTARVYTRPETPPQIHVSGFGPESTALAARIGDGYITTRPDRDALDRFRSAAGGGKTTTGSFKVSWAPTQDEGVRTAHRLWGTSGLPGELAQVLPSPRHFEQAATLVPEEATRSSVTCGSDVAAHLAAFEPFLTAGFDDVYVANIGPHHADMMEAYRTEVLPQLRQARAA